MKRRWIAIAVYAGVIAVHQVTAEAATMRLAELLAGGTIASGDKLFSHFTYHFTGDMPAADNINVIPIQSSSGDWGIRFQGGFVDGVDDLFQASDALITYRVEATAPGQLITSAHVAGNIVAHDGGTGSVTETFLPTFSQLDQILRIPSTTDGLIDTFVLPQAQPWLEVQKDILLRANTSQVDLSFIDQTFSQVPEATSFFSIASGMLLLLSMQRRSRSSSGC